MSVNDGGPAFPYTTSDDKHYGGMSLRDFFAAHALQGLLANPHWVVALQVSVGGEAPQALIAIAFKHADAMLAQRATTSGKGSP